MVRIFQNHSWEGYLSYYIQFLHWWNKTTTKSIGWPGIHPTRAKNDVQTWIFKLSHDYLPVIKKQHYSLYLLSFKWNICLVTI